MTKSLSGQWFGISRGHIYFEKALFVRKDIYVVRYSSGAWKWIDVSANRFNILIKRFVPDKGWMYEETHQPLHTLFHAFIQTFLTSPSLVPFHRLSTCLSFNKLALQHGSFWEALHFIWFCNLELECRNRWRLQKTLDGTFDAGKEHRNDGWTIESGERAPIWKKRADSVGSTFNAWRWRTFFSSKESANLELSSAVVEED